MMYCRSGSSRKVTGEVILRKCKSVNEWLLVAGFSVCIACVHHRVSLHPFSSRELDSIASTRFPTKAGSDRYDFRLGFLY